MPDILLTNTQLPEQGNGGYLPEYQNTLPNVQNDPYNKAFADLAKMQKADAKSALMNLPYESPLSQALRYTDPNIGFNPLDKNLEYKYADAHPFQTFSNNLIQAGAKFLGAAAQTIATIPLAIDALVSKDASKLFHNDYSDAINGWLESLNNTLPVYRTKYEDEHPILKYLTPWNLKSWTGAIGEQVNNLGFMAGAIAGAFVEDAIITGLTGGTGLAPVAAAQAAQITKAMTKAGEVLVEAPKDALAVVRSTYRGAEFGADAIEGGATAIEAGAMQPYRGIQPYRALSKEGEFADDAVSILGEGTGMRQEAVDFERLTKGATLSEQKLDFWNKYYKIRDGAKYNLALLTSATSQGAFMAAGTYNRGKQELSERFFEVYGRAPHGQELKNIEKHAISAANFTMGANVALLYLGNRINWGSLFKPTTQALNEVESVIVGWGSNIKRVTKTATLKDVENQSLGKQIEYSLLEKAPETRIGKVLLNGEKLFAGQGKNLAMAGQFGLLMQASEGSLDYIKHKYDPNNLAEVGDFMKSFNEGLHKSFGTTEGWDNMVTGFIGGVAGGLFHAKMQKTGNKEQRLRDEVSILNSQHFNGTLENLTQEVAAQIGLAKEHKTNIENNDIHKAKNNKFTMLYNWVASGIRANSFEARLHELDMVRNLEGKSFTEFWKMEYTKENRETVNKYLDNVQRKAHNIKSDIEKVHRTLKNTFEPNTEDFKATEFYKDQLAYKLSSFRDRQERLKGISDKLKDISPLFDIEGAIKMTSVQGMSEILKKINESSNSLAEKIKNSEGNDKLQNEFFEKKKQLDNLASKLRTMIYSGETLRSGRTINVDFKGSEYIDIMHDLYDLHNGIDYENNKYLDNQKRLTDGKTLHIEEKQLYRNDDQLAEILEDLQDIYKLSVDSKDINKYYTYLRKGVGASEFIKEFKNIVDNNMANLDKNGKLKTDKDIENEIREEEYFNMERDILDEETTAEERETLKKAAKKVIDDIELTPEEETLSEDKHNIFNKFVKIEKTINDKVKEVKNNLPNNKVQSSTTVKPKNSIYSTTEPNNLFGMFSEDKSDIKFRTNLYNAIFKSGSTGVFSALKAVFSKLDITGRTKAFSKIGDSNIYRSTFEENINIYHNGENIGILRPSDSLWLDSEGKRSIYDMTIDEYVQVTGNDKGTYDQFMKDIKAYKKAYDGLKTEMEKNPEKEITIKDIEKYFNVSINIGSRIQNEFKIVQNSNGKYEVSFNGKEYGQFKTYNEAKEYTNRNTDVLAKNDTLIKDLNYKPKGAALISLTEVISVNNRGEQISKKTIKPEVLNRDELTTEQARKISKFIDENLEFLQKSGNRYILALPVGEEYIKGAVLFGRNTDTTTAEKVEYYNNVLSVANGTVRGREEQNALIKEINDKFFIANSDRNVKQTNITTSFDPEGNLVVKINNTGLKVYEDITIPKNEVIEAGSYEALMNTIQNKIDNTFSKDLKSLEIKLNEHSLKRQIPDDKVITQLKQVEDVLKVSTTANIFTNFGLNFKPKEEGISSGKTPNTLKGEVQTTLPQELAGAKPRYGYKNNLFELDFESDIDKAAYIASQNTKSKRDADYVKFVMDATGLTESQVRELGQTIRDNIKGIAKNADPSEPISIETTYNKTVEQPISKVTYVKDKAALTDLLQNLFKLDKEKAKNTADIFEQVAKSWANRTGKKSEDFYSTLGFSDMLEKAKNSDILKQGILDVQNISKGFNLVPQYSGSLFVGYKSKNGLVGKNLTDGLNDYIKKNNLNLRVLESKVYGTVMLEPAVKQGTLFQIIGEKGVTKLKEASIILSNLNVAKRMKSEFYDRSSIRNATGWEYNIDGKWRYEIPDTFTFNKKELDNLRYFESTTLGRLLENTELLKLYPELKKITVEKSLSRDSSYNHSAKEITITKNAFEIDQKNTRKLTTESEERIKRTLIHEIQHAIQEYEGFAKGGNTELFEAQLKPLKRELQDLTIKKENLNPNSEEYSKIQNRINEINDYLNNPENDPYKKYRRVAGEVEARNTETRMNYTDQERLSKTLNATEDIADESKIFLKNRIDTVNDLLINDAIDYIKYKSDNIKGYSKDALIDAAKNNVDILRQYLMDIAEQAKDPRSAKHTIETYGKDLVDIAQRYAENNISNYIPHERIVVTNENINDYLKNNKFIEQVCT